MGSQNKKTKLHKFISKYSFYLEKIRKRLFFLIISFIAFFSLGFIFSGYIIKFFIRFFDLKLVQIITVSPFQFMNLAVNTGVFMAIILTFPLALLQIFSFLKNALTPREKNIFYKIALFSLLLFCLGFIFGIFVMKYVVIAVAKINLGLDIANMWDIGLFLSQILLTASLLGIMFQFPLVLNFLIKFGLVKADFLRKRRRWAIVASLGFSALLPPTDIISLIIMALPLILLFEITLLINRSKRIKMVESYA